MTDLNQPGAQSTFRFRRRTPGSFFLVPSPKQSRAIRCQGQLEGMAATILVACPAVAHIQEQPLTIWYQWRDQGNTLQIELLESEPAKRSRNQEDGGVSYIIPDFLVEMTDGRKRLVEIKPSSRLAKSITQRKLEVARQFAGTEGWTFHLVTEKDLQDGPLLRNVQLVNRYRQAQTDSPLLLTLGQSICDRGVPLAALCHSVQKHDLPYVRMHVFHLLANGDLAFDPRKEPISDQTLIFPKGAITWDPFDSVWASSGC